MYDYVYLYVRVSMDICLYPCIKSSFPKRYKQHSNHWACNANAKFIDYVLKITFTCIYIYICIYIFISIHRVSQKMYSLFDCPLLIYILILFQMQITLNNDTLYLKLNVIFCNLTH